MFTPRIASRVLVAVRMSSTKAAEDAEVVFGSHGAMKTIRLNRPKALNALSLNMVRMITPQVEVWTRELGREGLVVMSGTGDKAFCAGGDVRAIAEAGKRGESLPREFFGEEYQLDYRLATMGLPHVALLDGITMGGGVGLSVHSSFRVATEKTLFAMPETAIGFFPDVGGSYFLPRLDGETGTFLALTGHRLKGGDCLYAGIATHFVPSASIPALVERLSRLSAHDNASVNAALLEFSVHPGAYSLFEHEELIDSAFSHNNVEEILKALDSSTSTFAQKTAATLRKMSPTAMAVTLRMVREGSKLSLADCFKMEFRLANAFMKGQDFYEGIRAVLVDKDNKPVWQPAASAEAVAACFEEDPAIAPLTLPKPVAAPDQSFGLVKRAAVEKFLKSGDRPAYSFDQVVAGMNINLKVPGNMEKLTHVLNKAGRRTRDGSWSAL